MKFRSTQAGRIPTIFWCLTIIAIAVWSQVPAYVVGWDLRVYQNAIDAMHFGHDPYADGIAVQRIYHGQLLGGTATGPTPFTYVYSPLTLPLLRLIGLLPFFLSGTIYWAIYALGLVAAIWVGMQFVETKEQKVFALLAPAAVFFPGLLQNDVLFSGNVAYILYGAVLAAALFGWRRGQWSYFYIAVMLASCCKANLLYLLSIPVLSARKQWIPAALTGVTGIGLFAMQPAIWPDLFKNYLTAVDLQFSFNHDFSSSPSGLLADALYDVVPYRIFTPAFYAFYAIGFFSLLLYISRKFLDGKLSIKRWVPLMLLGVFLLNPRIMEYDIAPITIPMALVAWRIFARGRSLQGAIILAGSVFSAFNLFIATNYIVNQPWRPTACITMVGLFFVGTWDLFREMRRNPQTEHAILLEQEA